MECVATQTNACVEGLSCAWAMSKSLPQSLRFSVTMRAKRLVSVKETLNAYTEFDSKALLASF